MSRRLGLYLLAVEGAIIVKIEDFEVYHNVAMD